MIRSFGRSLGLVVMLAALVGQASLAHAGTLGGIAGIVTDAKTGAPVAGVHLQISSPSQTVNAVTDAHGHYTVLSLPPDDYTFTAVKEGYTTESFPGYSVFADQTQVYDLKLDPSTS